jgi:hypothetical protein
VDNIFVSFGKALGVIDIPAKLVEEWVDELDSGPSLVVIISLICPYILGKPIY